MSGDVAAWTAASRARAGLPRHVSDEATLQTVLNLLESETPGSGPGVSASNSEPPSHPAKNGGRRGRV